MKQTIIIHGLPEKEEFYSLENPSQSNRHWFPWLQKQLAMRDQISQALEFPRPYDPVYSDWKFVIENFAINSETMLIGHSCGGGFLLRYLSEHPELKPGKVILVAPWTDPDRAVTTDFFDFVIDKSLAERTELHVFVSSDDHAEVIKTVDMIRKEVSGIIWHEYTNREHFCDKEFPELLEILK